MDELDVQEGEPLAERFPDLARALEVADEEEDGSPVPGLRTILTDGE